MSAALAFFALAAAPSLSGACIVADAPARAGADLLARRLHERGSIPRPIARSRCGLKPRPRWVKVLPWRAMAARSRCRWARRAARPMLRGGSWAT
ncbi:hypothetical protein ACFS32_19500 [Novosphingobium pokkalii]|uniref:hypothetical protein n=1 Tax=Novosphingobium pokkalii TaxID=1770194 RepID=UPI003633DBDF